ncbi:hypothetical protein NDU88_005373 [Pleurodeles waltl]|uniref:Uncharacterized protein n=1 Tax=Pleurodeles waltl TaxID=8319 RepID=A0AAV7SLJ2_PLEWA|nr:hypothetical protein NDU88_005373 [Pleurodeles waltl]
MRPGPRRAPQFQPGPTTGPQEARADRTYSQRSLSHRASPYLPGEHQRLKDHVVRAPRLGYQALAARAVPLRVGAPPRSPALQAQLTR